LSFLKDHIFERLKNQEDFFDKIESLRFIDKNILSKIEEVKKYQRIGKFKKKFLEFLIKKTLNIFLDYDFEDLPYEIYTLRDVWLIKDVESFYMDFYKVIKKYGIIIDFRYFREKIRFWIDFVVKNYFGFAFFYEIYGVYSFLKSRFMENGLEFIESGSIARFDKFIENICFIFPFCVNNPMQWIKDVFKDIQIIDFDVFVNNDFGYAMVNLNIAFCRVPLILVFCDNWILIHLYFLFSNRLLLNVSLEEFLKNSIKLGVKSVDDFYEILGVNFIPFELIDYPNIFELAKTENFKDLIELSDIKGDLHIHSSFSDGKNSIEEIVRYSKKKDYEYVGISDHVDYLVSKDDSYANLEEIDGVYIWWAVEENIDSKGYLFSAFNEKASRLVERLNYINLSIHSDFKLSEHQNLERIKRALSFRKGLIFCHPTSRILGIREPIKISKEEMFKIFDYTIENNKYIEINSHLDRLDLDYNYIIDYKMIKGKELNLVINTDAHSLNQMDYMEFGVKWARKAMVKKQNVLNTQNLHELKQILCNI
ncbi:MAG: PHP domain-containing protein, partial [bacterium]